LVVGGPGGPPSIGLYAAGLAVALGASRVVYVDDDPARRAIASALGAEVKDDPTRRKVGAFPITVNAGGHEAHLRCALNSTAFDGTCTNVAVFLEDPALPLFQMYSRCCTLHTGRAHARPAIPAVLDLVAAGRFDPSLVTSEVVDWDHAVDALADPPMKLVVQRA
jgi:alcohol dehydrogenase